MMTRLYYQCDGDSDGETVGYDHLVVDAAGNQVCSVPDEETGKLFAAAPVLLRALRRLVNRQQGREQWPEVRGAEAAIRLAVDGGYCPRDAETLGLTDGMQYGELKHKHLIDPYDWALNEAYQIGFTRGFKSYQQREGEHDRVPDGR